MLLNRATLDAIATGEITLVFRRWKRPTVKTGGSLRTAVGMLAIGSVDRIPMRAITADDAHRAGFPSRARLLEELSTRDGHCYRIEVSLGGADPLETLRNQTDLAVTDIEELDRHLDRLDRSGPPGAWTRQYLSVIAEHPHVRAEDLAGELGIDKPTFKTSVRKLKALGLTISHSPGYELSPRGRAYLDLRPRAGD